MKLSTHTKSRLVGWTDQITGLGLKIGGATVALSLIYLLVTVFGGHIRDAAKLAGEDRAYLAQSIDFAVQALVVGSIVLVASLVLRFTMDEAVGQALSVVGALFYFGSPAFFGAVIDPTAMRGNAMFASVIAAFRNVGGICLLPGLFLVLRDAILRIWTGISVKRVLERRWGDEEERKKHVKPKFYGSCWDMLFCRDFVRRVCPAYAARKPCWRIKIGCYCDENTILRAMTSAGADNEHARGIINSLGLNRQSNTRLSNKLKRERCRRCGIYAEHQRQKYRLLSPMVFPAVGVLLYVFYRQISMWVGIALQKTDRFMSFLAYGSQASGYAFSDQGQVLTTLAIAWLTIIVISYALRTLEYLVFELQV